MSDRPIPHASVNQIKGSSRKQADFRFNRNEKGIICMEMGNPAFFRSCGCLLYRQEVAFDNSSSILSIPCRIRLISARRSAISRTFSSNCVLGKLTLVVIILPRGEAFDVACRLVRLNVSVPCSSSVRPPGVSRAESSSCRISAPCWKTARIVDCVLAPRNDLDTNSEFPLR
jgi:hypothetical protein